MLNKIQKSYVNWEFGHRWNYQRLTEKECEQTEKRVDAQSTELHSMQSQTQNEMSSNEKKSKQNTLAGCSPSNWIRVALIRPFLPSFADYVVVVQLFSCFNH